MTLPKPLAVYIHWPFCLSKCPYCDFNSHVRASVDQSRWRGGLLRELEFMAGQLPNRRVHTIFFGGGTPSLMPPDTAAALIEAIGAYWPVADEVEITLEANPTSVEADTFPAFRQAGINRVSLGVQSLRQDELTFLGRGHTVKEALTAIGLAATHFERSSFDLIYARPGQTVASWQEELGEALALTNGHISLYQLTIEENTAFHHAYAQGGFVLPDEQVAEALYRTTEAMTSAHGLAAYEVSNYAKPGQESRHNLAYWQGTDYIGIGPGAHGRLTRGGKRHATQTLKSPERWLEQVERSGHGIELWQDIDRMQEMEERIMMGLRLTGGIQYRVFADQTGQALTDYIAPKKRDFFIAQGLLEDRQDALCATLKGRLVLNRLTAELLG